MKISKSVVAASAFAAVLLGAASAQAATVTKTYDFSLGDFVDVIGNNAAPLATITGSFTLTFDPAVGVNNDTADITTNSLSDTHINSPIGFGFAPGTPLFISIGGLQNGDGSIAQFSNDFVLQLKFANAASLDSPMLSLCSDGFACGSAPGATFASGYTLLDHNGAWLAREGSVTVGGGVPEPASWALMMLGFGGLGAALRTRRKGFAATA